MHKPCSERRRVGQRPNQHTSTQILEPPASAAFVNLPAGCTIISWTSNTRAAVSATSRNCRSGSESVREGRIGIGGVVGTRLLGAAIGGTVPIGSPYCAACFSAARAAARCSAELICSTSSEIFSRNGRVSASRRPRSTSIRLVLFRKSIGSGSEHSQARCLSPDRHTVEPRHALFVRRVRSRSRASDGHAPRRRQAFYVPHDHQ
jgi:hypothetical protein